MTYWLVSLDKFLNFKIYVKIQSNFSFFTDNKQSFFKMIRFLIRVLANLGNYKPFINKRSKKREVPKLFKLTSYLLKPMQNFRTPRSLMGEK